MFGWILCIALVLDSGFGKTPTQTVDLIELNHALASDGKAMFTQVILRKWSHDYRRWDVVSWCIPSSIDGMPRKVRDHYEVKFGNFASGPLVVSSAMFIETTTIGDPERNEKRLFPESMREGLITNGRPAKTIR